MKTDMGPCVLIMRRMLCRLLIWCFAVVSVDDEERYQPGRVLPCRTA